MRRRALGLALVPLVAAALVLVTHPPALHAEEPAAPEDFIEACSNGVAVPDPEDNPGLVQDCAILLSIRDTLAGDATLDWSPDLPIEKWQGVTVDGNPRRAAGLHLSGAGLTGTIPEALGNLVGLSRIALSSNSLAGSIPASIGRLSGLQYLDLASNRLTGSLPPSLWDLSELEYLYLSWNNLFGEVPEDVGNLKGLKFLGLHHNGFSGPLPASLTALPALESVQVLGNHFSCSPHGLRKVLDDVDYITLPVCVPEPADTGTGLAPTPPAAVPVAVNVLAVLVLATAVLGIVAGLRARYRP